MNKMLNKALRSSQTENSFSLNHFINNTNFFQEIKTNASADKTHPPQYYFP